MTLFFVLGALCLIVAMAFIVVPLRKTDMDRRMVFVLAAALPLYAGFFYYLFSNYEPGLDYQQGTAEQQVDEIGSIEEMVARLEQRLQTEGGSAEDWFMMGRSYVAMRRFSDAVPAFAKANELSGGNDPGILISYAEVLAVNDPESLKTDAATMIEQALKLAPMDPRGLWWGGLAALERGDEALARQRWTSLLDLNPPEVLAQAVERQLQILSGGPLPQDSETAEVARSPEITVPLRVTVDESLLGQLNPAAALYVFVRSPDAGGPPLAVSRHSVAELPLEISLGQANVMLPGTRLSDYTRMKLVARLSNSGTPVAQRGDLFGEVDYEAGQDGLAEIVINRVVE